MKGARDSIWPRLLLSGILVGLFTIPCAAQIPPPSPQNQPQPNPQPAVQEVAPVGGSTTTPAQTPLVLPGATQSSTVGKTFGSVGRGLPGMPGGPPLNGRMGAQDPSPSYMSPPTVGPLLCDPELNIPCE